MSSRPIAIDQERNMTKFWKLICPVLALAVLLAGCAAGKQTETEPTKEPSMNAQLSGPLSLGDQMPELTVTTVEGETLVLSQLLEQKKLVVLNFWFADCIWCIREFPVMEVSYQQYREEVEILALNPYDPPETIGDFQQEHALSFPMAGCSRDLTQAFGVTGYPTSVVIDRNGTVCLIHSGAITEKAVFDKLFQTFTAEDYTPKLYHSVNDLL